MVFKPGQKFATRGGSLARIYAVDGGTGRELHGAVWNEIEDMWTPCSWDSEGYFVSKEYPRSLDILVEDDGLQE